MICTVELYQISDLTQSVAFSTPQHSNSACIRSKPSITGGAKTKHLFLVIFTYSNSGLPTPTLMNTIKYRGAL